MQLLGSIWLKGLLVTINLILSGGIPPIDLLGHYDLLRSICVLWILNRYYWLSKSSVSHVPLGNRSSLRVMWGTGRFLRERIGTLRGGLGLGGFLPGCTCKGACFVWATLRPSTLILQITLPSLTFGTECLWKVRSKLEPSPFHPIYQGLIVIYKEIHAEADRYW